VIMISSPDLHVPKYGADSCGMAGARDGLKKRSDRGDSRGFLHRRPLM
jgi:hypothetical protein